MAFIWITVLCAYGMFRTPDSIKEQLVILIQLSLALSRERAS